METNAILLWHLLWHPQGFFPAREWCWRPTFPEEYHTYLLIKINCIKFDYHKLVVYILQFNIMNKRHLKCKPDLSWWDFASWTYILVFSSQSSWTNSCKPLCWTWQPPPFLPQLPQGPLLWLHLLPEMLNHFFINKVLNLQ